MNRKYHPLLWAFGTLWTGILAMLISSQLPKFSTLGYIILGIGIAECWDTLADHFRFGGFSTAEELQRGNNAVALYFLGRAILVVGCLHVGVTAL